MTNFNHRMITVGATSLVESYGERRARPWDYGWREAGSNFGYRVDIFAPGTGIRTTTRRDYGYTYRNYSGTSLAAPMVAGTAAIMRLINPSITIAQIIQAIIDNVDFIPALYGISRSNGRLNTHRAIAAVTMHLRPVSSDEIMISGLAGYNSVFPLNTHLVIPDRIAPPFSSSQLPIVAVSGICRQIGSVVLPNYLRTIGMSAFANNVNLASVILPSSLERIEANAFANNPNLRTIDINRANSVMQIMSNSFAGSNNIQ
ncbi:MAG: leucine-rich repeat protein, partial [Firmicutes bacterium]|nr:leucine-rich repeat protein [Bacillota bacterium]